MRSSQRHVCGLGVFATVALFAAPIASGAPGATAPVTRAASCTNSWTTGSASGPSRVTRTPRVALVRNVQVQASSCIDEIAFLFRGGVPGWSAGYHGGALVADPSGKPVKVAGSVHLVIRFSPASGVDFSSSTPTVTYNGPKRLRPAKPSGIAEVRELGDFEAVSSWAIGLSSRRPFQVVTRGNQLVVRIAATNPRVTRCSAEGPSTSVGYPAGWYAELSSRWACRYFDPKPFVIYPSTDKYSWAVTVERVGTAASKFVAAVHAGGNGVHSHSVRIAGLRATVLDVTESGKAMYPAGYQYRVYVFNTGANALTVSSTPGRPGPNTNSDRVAADRIAALIRLA